MAWGANYLTKIMVCVRELFDEHGGLHGLVVISVNAERNEEVLPVPGRIGTSPFGVLIANRSLMQYVTTKCTCITKV